MKQTLLVLLIVILSTPGVTKESKSDDYPKRFRAAYDRAKNGNSRMELCIKAINDDVITTGVSIASVDRLFEGQQKLTFIESGTYFRRIHFERFMPGNNDAEGGFSAGHYPGWHLFIQVNGEGIVTAYYLTNIPKVMLVR